MLGYPGELIEQSDLERVITSGDEAFVKYLCHTTNGKSFRNVEYLRVRGGKVEPFSVILAGQLSVSSKQGDVTMYLPAFPVAGMGRKEWPASRIQGPSWSISSFHG